MAAFRDCSGDLNWRKNILSQLQNRNRTQTHGFQDLIIFHNRLFESTNALRAENLQLSVQNEKLKHENVELQCKTGSSDGKPNELVQTLEQKLFHLQEELTELHRRKGENAQQLVDLNHQLQEKEKKLAVMEAKLTEASSKIIGLTTELQTHQAKMKELENVNQMLKDEHQALQLAFASLEMKLRQTQDENRELVERLIRIKATHADQMNEENENFVKRKQAIVQKELEEAAKDTKPLSPDRLAKDGVMMYLTTVLPTKALIKFDAHEGEVNAVKWSPVGRLMATGGADRKVKLWDISKGTYESKGMLVGSNAGVMSVDFDSMGTMILGASNDFASRVWTVEDQRVRHTLTGHSGKVLAAKFLGEPSKVVSGSHDRTLKVWDLRSRICESTKFAGSSCNDLVTCDGSGSIIISGHFDKRIRFWDMRSETTTNDIMLQGKVTSLDLSKDSNYLLTCVRDDTLKILDLRMNQVVGNFTADGFKVGCDWARAAFSPDGQYVTVGSADGSIFIWNASSGKVETILKDHTSAVTAVAWHPYGTYLVSVDRGKKAIIWGDV